MSGQPAGDDRTLGLSVHELLSTTRAVRKRLDFDRAVDDDLLRECLEYTVQAPTGSNRQGWRFVVVTDADKRACLADLYRRGWDLYTTMAVSAGALADGAPTDQAAQQMRVMESATYLAENMHRVPAMVIPCIEGRIDRSGMGAASVWDPSSPAPGASCWPPGNGGWVPAGRPSTSCSKRRLPPCWASPTTR